MIEYFIFPPTKDQPEDTVMYGWRLELDGEQFGNQLLVNEDGEHSQDDIDNILKYNAGDSLARIILGEVEYPEFDESSTQREILEFDAQMAGYRFFQEIADKAFEKGYKDLR